MKQSVTLVVDSREQKPYWIGSECFKTALIIGDYTTVLLQNKYHIERKSPIDWYGTITKGHARFNREIQRAKENKVKFSVYVECTREEFVTMNFEGAYRLKIKPETIEKIVTTMQKRYKLDIVWCKTRVHAKKQVHGRLLAEQKKLKR